MKGKTKTILTVIIAILVFAIAVVGTVTFLKDDGEASAAEGTTNTLPVTGSDDEQTNTNGEQNPAENLNGDENPEEQPEDGENENPAEGTTATGNQGTTGNRNPGTTTGGQTEPEPTVIEQERLVSTTLNWNSISLNNTIGRTGINYTKLGYTIKYYQVVSEDEIKLLNTETGKEDYGTTVTVTEDQIKENCPTGYKLDEENSKLSTTITENVDGNVIEVYYIKDFFDLKIEYVYEDGTPAADPYEDSIEYEGEYRVESPEIEGYTPDIEVVEGTMPGEDITVKVTYKVNSYKVTYVYEGTVPTDATELPAEATYEYGAEVTVAEDA
ncbi:MAG: MucBP domain-containing protein, partial [Clostridia bacterium]|nr:MucBP domain-containing protein [Clostridia bacterium]